MQLEGSEHVGLQTGYIGTFVRQGLSTEFTESTSGNLCTYDTLPPNDFPLPCVEERYALNFSLYLLFMFFML